MTATTPVKPSATTPRPRGSAHSRTARAAVVLAAGHDAASRELLSRPLGSATVVELAVARDDLEWFELPPLARRLIGHVDGSTPLETVCVCAGVSLVDAINLLGGLARDKLVVCR